MICGEPTSNDTMDKIDATATSPQQPFAANRADRDIDAVVAHIENAGAALAAKALERYGRDIDKHLRATKGPAEAKAEMARLQEIAAAKIADRYKDMAPDSKDRDFGVKAVARPDGKTDIYFGGFGHANGAGHGHIVVDAVGRIEHVRGPSDAPMTPQGRRDAVEYNFNADAPTAHISDGPR